MATDKSRINVVLSKQSYDLIKQLSENEGASLSFMVKHLTEEVLKWRRYSFGKVCKRKRKKHLLNQWYYLTKRFRNKISFITDILNQGLSQQIGLNSGNNKRLTASKNLYISFSLINVLDNKRKMKLNGSFDVFSSTYGNIIIDVFVNLKYQTNAFVTKSLSVLFAP